MTWTAADRDQLLCLLALKNGLIDHKVLATSMFDSGSLDGESLLDAVVRRSGLSRDVFTTLSFIAESIVSEYPDSPREYLAALADSIEGTRQPDATGSFRPQAENHGDDFATRVPSPADFAETQNRGEDAQGTDGEIEVHWREHRFTRLRPHAKGGLGEVFVAMDRELDREVALKEIQDHHADRSDSRARFFQEAKVTGALEHPGIVPVYGLGHYADGRPYYAMRFIRGKSLKESIQEYHTEPNLRSSTADRLMLQQLLRRFLDVCNAISFAHSKGVLHRDLKPANVMLGQFGETLVVDWGLAKVKGVADQTDEASRDGGGAGRISGSLSGSSAETLPGSAMGTPQFMSPEQAQGDLDSLGAASDVYSLGATLYTVITGHAPFEDKTIAEVLDKVSRGEFPRPRQISRKIHPGLDAICCKAMALHPADRYESVQLLAQDIEHWLADEPVLAQRETWFSQSHRWLRRHRTWAQAIASALILVTIVSVFATIFVGKERDAADGARVRAMENLVKADRSRLAAVEATNQAKASQKQAETAQVEASQQKEKALSQLYLASMGLAQQEWNVGNVGRAEQLLDSCPERFWGWERRYLKALCHSDSMTYSGQSSVARLIAFSPDGKRVISVDAAGILKTWDTETGRSLSSRMTDSLGLAFDSSRTRMVGITNDPKEYLIWDLTKETSPTRIVMNGTRGVAAAFRPDGKQLALVKDASLIQLWDLEKGVESSILSGRADPLVYFTYSPDGKLIAVARRFGWIEIWDLETGKRRHEFRGHPGEGIEVQRVEFRPDSKALVSVGLDGGRVWDVADAHQIGSLQANSSFLYCGSFSPDGKRIATSGADRTVRVWDTTTFRELANFRGHTHEVTLVTWSPDGTKLLSSSNDTTLRTWDVGNEAITSPPSATAASSNAGSSTEPRVAPLRTLGGHTGAVSAFSFSPDSKRMATVSWDGYLITHDLATGGILKKIQVTTQNALSNQIRMLRGGTAFSTSVGAVAFSPDGKRIATGTESSISPAIGFVRIFDSDTGENLKTFKDDMRGPIACLVYSPDGKRLLVGTGGVHPRFRGIKQTCAVIDAEDGKVIASYDGHSQSLFDGCLSPDGKLAATVAFDGGVHVWDTTTGAKKMILRPADEADTVFRGVAWSLDGKTIAATGLDQSVWLFDVSTQKETRKLKGHAGEVYRAAFTPDGQRLATTGRDATVKLWNVATGDEVLSFREHTSEIYDLAFSPDGQTLASAGFDQKTILRSINFPDYPKTDGWDVVLSDDFERQDLGDRWDVVCGDWSIEKGAAKGAMHVSRRDRHPFDWATLVPKGLYLPSQAEVRCEVWSPDAINVELKLHESSSLLATEGLLGILSGSAKQRYESDRGSTLLIEASNAYRNVLTNPRFVLEPGVHRKVRMLRERRRFTVWIDGEEALSVPIPDLIVPVLHLQAGYGKPGDVVYLDNVEIRRPREAAREQNALKRLAELTNSEPLLADALAKLKTDTSIDGATKELALAIGSRQEQSPNQLINLTYPVVIKSGCMPEEYQLALKRLESLIAKSPDYRQAREQEGAALYRLGRYDEALKALTAANELRMKQGLHLAPAQPLVFRAMSEFRLGHRPEAAALLDELGLSLAGQPGVASAVVLRDEAEALIGSKAATERQLLCENITKIAQAMHAYHEKELRFPSSAISSTENRPLLSWRVALLPYLGEEALYSRFKLDEPWDSPSNQPLIKEMPAVYSRAVAQPNAGGLTPFRVFSGANTLFDDKTAMNLAKITDGTINTILAVESSESVPWTKPDELLVPKDGSLPKLGTADGKRATIVLASGTVIVLEYTAETDRILRRMITPSGGENVDSAPLTKWLNHK